MKNIFTTRAIKFDSVRLPLLMRCCSITRGSYSITDNFAVIPNVTFAVAKRINNIVDIHVSKDKINWTFVKCMDEKSLEREFEDEEITHPTTEEIKDMIEDKKVTSSTIEEANEPTIFSCTEEITNKENYDAHDEITIDRYFENEESSVETEPAEETEIAEDEIVTEVNAEDNHIEESEIVEDEEASTNDNDVEVVHNITRNNSHHNNKKRHH